jgi:transposase
MPKRLTAKPHLSLDELAARYRSSKVAVERSHWQIVWLLAQGKTTQEIATVTGYSVPWIRAIIHRYNHAGPAVLGDLRRANPGGSFLLSAAQQAKLQQTLDASPPPDGGLWSGPKVAAWILAQTGRQVSPQRGWEYLKRLGFSQRVLRPRHAKADPAAQDAFKKTSPTS